MSTDYLLKICSVYFIYFSGKEVYRNEQNLYIINAALRKLFMHISKQQQSNLNKVSDQGSHLNAGSCNSYKI